MDRATISRIEEWETRPSPGGYVGLNELADDGFTGAVARDGALLFMLNGRIVGVSGGAVSTFEDGDATAYTAPDPALPLLFAMREHEGEVRGSYYTDDTPIREVDETLADGGFTGYLELSENVLSGDYYVVYYGGRSLAAAFVGNEGRVVTGDDAFDLAADEVGIYEVTAVDLDVADVPEPPADAVAAATTTEEPGSAGEEPIDDAADDDAEPVDAEPDELDGADEAEKADADEPDDEPVEEPAAAETDDEAAEAEPEIPDAEDGDDADADQAPEGEPADEDVASGSGSAATGATDGDATDAEVERAASPAGPGSAGRTAGASPERVEQRRREQGGSEPDPRFEEEARWRETRTVPALDPDESEEPREEPAADPTPQDEEEEAPPAEPAAADPPDADVRALEERLQRLEAELEANEEERRRLDERVEAVVEERDELAAERDELAERVERLESRLEEARAAPESAAASAAGASGGAGGRSVDPETALDQTDLFVRYGSKSRPTLTTAHDGQAGAGEVAENLRIDSHSRFDAATATVDGRPFDAFLEGTIQYRFVSWLVEVLLYEIRETGTEGGLRALYDVLPEIDRAEFNGSVTRTDEEGAEHTEAFDVVCRNRMGKPLIVANINDSLDPATGDMMETLVEDATEVAEAHESIGAAFLVTASFFQPDALETAADATRGGGFLSRDSKKSFVKLSRSGGYHLCLVEARGDDFHVAVPEF